MKSVSRYFYKLLGKKIVRARILEGEIILDLDGGPCIVLSPYGDCCAHCYIQHVSLSNALVDATVTGVEEIMSEPTDTEKASNTAEVFEGWGHRIHTTRGTCSIEMRVEHNGYYGGELQCEERDANYRATAPLLEDF